MGMSPSPRASRAPSHIGFEVGGLKTEPPKEILPSSITLGPCASSPAGPSKANQALRRNWQMVLSLEYSVQAKALHVSKMAAQDGL